MLCACDEMRQGARFTTPTRTGSGQRSPAVLCVYSGAARSRHGVRKTPAGEALRGCLTPPAAGGVRGNHAPPHETGSGSCAPGPCSEWDLRAAGHLQLRASQGKIRCLLDAHALRNV